MKARTLADEHPIGEMRVKIGSLFDPPLELLGVDWVQIEVKNREQDYLDQDLRIKVPDGTRYVHAALKSMDIAFGSRAKNTPKALGSIWTQFKIKSWSDTDNKLVLDKGDCIVNFKAMLQDAATVDAAGKWSGWFDVEIMCFGKK